MKKVVIHIFHDDKSSLGTGSHVSERIRQVKDQHGVELELYVFGPGCYRLRRLVYIHGSSQMPPDPWFGEPR